MLFPVSESGLQQERENTLQLESHKENLIKIFPKEWAECGETTKVSAVA